MSKTSTSGRTSGAATKANVAIAEDDHITLLDPSSPPVPERIGHSWMAIAEDDLIQLLDSPIPDNVVHVSSPDVLPISNLNSISPADHLHAHTAKARVKDVDLSEKWLIDSGASWIMCSNCHWFYQYTPLSPPVMITLGDNSTIPAIGQGRIQVRMNAGRCYEHAMLHDVLYVPDMGGNLLSVSHFARRGAEVRFKGNYCHIMDEAENTSCISHLRGNLYIMDMKVIANEHAKIAFVDSFPSEGDDPPPMALAATSSTATANLTMWHQRLSHLNANTVSMMHTKQMVTGMDITQGTTLVTACEPCLRGKQTCAEIHKTTGM